MVDSFGKRGVVGSVIRLPDLTNLISAGDPILVEFGLERTVIVRMLKMVLAMAVRDGAVAVFYHSWRPGWNLSYLVGGRLHALAPPPPEFAHRVARALDEHPEA
jgi:hypothetical protein